MKVCTSTSLKGHTGRYSGQAVIRKSKAHLSARLEALWFPPMTRDEATSLLVAASGDASAVADTEIDRLLEELQRLPLAVSQAGAYLRRTSMTIKEYLELLMQGSSRWDLLKTNDFDRHRRPEVSNSVLETWKISTRRIREESELSYRLLHIIAYVDNQDIPYELIMAASQYDVGDKGKAKQISDTEVKQAITRLVEFSFLDMRREEGGLQSYEMHKLVQEAVRYGLCTQGRMEMAQGMITTTGQDNTETGEAYYASMTLQIVDDMFPITEKTSWATCDKYMAHAIRVGEWAEVSGKKVETVKLLDKVSGFLYDRGRWREKEPLDLRVLDLRRETLGEMHPGTIWSLASLAGTYFEQGRYDEAERICTKALNLRQEVLGEKHQHAIWSMQLLAVIYTEQGRYTEAEGICKQALNIQCEVLGENHADTMWTMSYLSVVHIWQGQYSKAEGICKQILHFRRKEFGDNHPDTIKSIRDLVETYYGQGHYDKAEELQKQVLDFRQGQYGEEHPQTLREMGSLAIIYCSQDRFAEAERILNRVLHLYQKLYGEKHPFTIKVMAELSKALGAQGQYDKAEGMQMQVLDLQREVMGDKHPYTTRSMKDLGTTYFCQGRYHDAERIYEQALVIQREVFGENHPFVLQTMGCLARALSVLGQYDKAEELQRSALELQRELLGEKHPDTITSIRRLELIKGDRGRKIKWKPGRGNLRGFLHSRFRKSKE
ncbi:uncharacterized protein TrAtP1_003952 [Trichoderma atroviride]|uniref:uncharacterized protein n=1 Tax=Hypocrea atroviridis TaxID=63577 RepID=UPI00332E8F2B|nr:hypothetical protein TrAtP1_003952 [Trichoderma atroviride]